MNSTTSTQKMHTTVHVVPHTGFQIIRNVEVNLAHGVAADEVWKCAERKATSDNVLPTVELVSRHIACRPMTAETATGWMACDRNEGAYFRLMRGTDDRIKIDLVIDTERGAGAQIENRFDCVVTQKSIWPWWPKIWPWRQKQFELASFWVIPATRAQGRRGSFIIDFGNTASTFLFAEDGTDLLRAEAIKIQNPWDVRYSDRTDANRMLFRSNLILLKVDESKLVAPWLVMGARADELIRQAPSASFVFAPKKYVRHWAEHQQHLQPRDEYRGIVGQRPGAEPKLPLVRSAVRELLQLAIGSICNPNCSARMPGMYPLAKRIMLTYPLTWREVDRELFREMVESGARSLVYLPPDMSDAFTAELICSEPVAVAAYILWEALFQFGIKKSEFTSSVLGNVRGTSELRLLVVDIGGGSTDIALVDIGWQKSPRGQAIDVTFRLADSMRFNRAGDRISHLIATAVWLYFRERYGICESLNFEVEAKERAFDRQVKRQIVSELSSIAEQVKVTLTTDEQWELASDVEGLVISRMNDCFSGMKRNDSGEKLRISRTQLQQWIEQDLQSMESRGEPGFMDIFLYLEELQQSLRMKDKSPHLVILSGRTVRLPFIREMVARHVQMPLHRVRPITEFLPDSLKTHPRADIEKLAVVYGAQRFRFGSNVRFCTLPDERIFNRYIGTVQQSPRGMLLNDIHIRPGDSRPRTIEIEVMAGNDVILGHAFREDGIAEVLANISNCNLDKSRIVTIDILDDFTLQMHPNENVHFSEWVPGGGDMVIDNYNDTGRIDEEPQGFIAKIIGAASDEKQAARTR